ncbi:NlpC/P60 family protein [Streptomyces sp. NPDC001744]|uniref:NlpC/P60 family protein n=1 Tax=Streptomyces sp. NPDC001744 TaxID=3364606 RepID=UPI00368010BF
MSGRLLRTVCTGALAAVTALAGTAPAAGRPVDPPVEPPMEAPIAWADPALEPVGPVDPVTSPGTPQDTGAPVTTEPADAPDTASAPDATDPVAPARPAGSAGSNETLPPDDAAALPPSGGTSVATLLTRLRTLYRQAEEATERYNAAEEALKRQTSDTREVTARLAAARADLARGRAEAGRIAREQYRGRTELSSYLEVLFAPDPGSALDRGRLVARAGRSRATVVSRLEGAAKQADALAGASREALGRQQRLAAERRTRRDEVRTRLAEVEKLLAGLSRGQLTRLTELERAQTAGAQRELLGSGVLDGRRTPSRAGAEALRFAVEQLGKPYEWGAEGPDAYDCSGLTQRAWAAAGREIPRTSQEQWATLPRVPLPELRPGDLVVYFPGATHVALYLGGGLVVQAPRPGAKVKVSPVAANPLLGAVRPDPDGTALTSYVPPELPEGAKDGGDAGFDRG